MDYKGYEIDKIPGYQGSRAAKWGVRKGGKWLFDGPNIVGFRRRGEVKEWIDNDFAPFFPGQFAKLNWQPIEEEGMQASRISKELLKLASELIAEDSDEEGAFAGRVRGLKQSMVRGLKGKKNKRLKEFGVGLIRPNMKVKDLVDALVQVVNAE